jgi:hypothetical protein
MTSAQEQRRHRFSAAVRIYSYYILEQCFLNFDRCGKLHKRSVHTQKLNYHSIPLSREENAVAFFLRIGENYIEIIIFSIHQHKVNSFKQRFIENLI